MSASTTTHQRGHVAHSAARVVTEAPECIACGQHAWKPLHRVLAQCPTCSFVRADMQVSEDELRKLYQSDYFRGQEYGDYLADAAVHRKNFSRRWQMLKQLTGGVSSVYEIGCAYGFWLDEVTKQGVRAAGVDICAEPVQYAAKTLGQNAACGDFMAQSIERNAYQMFCMWDTIEHLPHPEQFVARVAELLPSGGWFCCTTGDIGSRVAQRQGPRWRMIHPPTHLQYFSQATLRLLLERNGLEVVELKSTPMYRSLGGTLAGLSLFSRGPMQAAAKLAARVLPRALQDNVGYWLDLGDIMIAVARKP